MSTKTKWMPMEIDRITEAFPANVVERLMPSYKDIPREFTQFNGTKWNELVGDWFHSGLSKLELKPKEGIEEEAAIKHISTIMRSYEPKHEHKEAACAYLLSLWFDDADWEPGKAK